MDATAVAFARFQRDFVDLDPDEVKTARASRDFLIEQVNTLRQNKPGFPPYTGATLAYGSFARGTKIRPIDDVDTLFFLNGRNTTENLRDDGRTAWLHINHPDAPLNPYRDDHGFVNSTKVLNATRDALSDVKHYRKADVKKNMEAVTLALASHNWVFDIVPAVPVDDGKGGTAHFLVPDGRGEWKRTDPRADAQRLAATNTAHLNAFTPLCRLLKYWNARNSKPQLPSYYFETLVHKIFLREPITTTATAVQTFFTAAPIVLGTRCPDPNGFGPDLDAEVDAETKRKVSAAMAEGAGYVQTALIYPYLIGPEQIATWVWRKIFGPDFNI